MYALFYGGQILFGGVGYILGAIGAMDVLRRRGEKHAVQLNEAMASGYWSGFGQAWPIAYKNGEEHMLGVCQALALESIDMVQADQLMQHEFNQLVDSWPEYAFPQQDFMPW